MLEILLKTEPRKEPISIHVEEGTTVDDLYIERIDEVPHPILLAKVGNKYHSLNTPLHENCSVELLDIRNQAANLVYQHSLSLIYLTAIRHVMGDVMVHINNSLNQGLYTQIKGQPDLPEETLRAIDGEMRRLVQENLPIRSVSMPREEGLEFLRKEKRMAAVREFEQMTDMDPIRFYELDGYRDCFYGSMAPTTGHVPYFELRKYGRGILLRFPLRSNPSEIPEFTEQIQLFRTFGEQLVWDRILDVSYAADLNEKVENGEYPELMMISEALHEKKIAEIADRIKQEKKRIILIAGPSSSGKTTFARRLCIQLKVNDMDALYMGTDDYFVERDQTPLDENGEPDYEGLDAIDIELFNQNMNDLLAGKQVDLPTFDFKSGKKVYGQRITQIKPHQPIVIEGIHGLNEKMTAQIPKEEKFKIYISPLTQQQIDEHTRIPTTDERLLRRMVRDFQFRNHSAQGTLLEWPKVRKGEDVNIFPYSDDADVVFNSYHVYEIAVLKKYAEPLLEAIQPDDPAYAEAQRILMPLRLFRTIDDDSMIVNNSIIREFIGGSVLTH